MTAPLYEVTITFADGAYTQTARTGAGPDRAYEMVLVDARTAGRLVGKVLKHETKLMEEA